MFIAKNIDLDWVNCESSNQIKSVNWTQNEDNTIIMYNIYRITDTHAIRFKLFSNCYYYKISEIVFLISQGRILFGCDELVKHNKVIGSVF